MTRPFIQNTTQTLGNSSFGHVYIRVVKVRTSQLYFFEICTGISSKRYLKWETVPSIKHEVENDTEFKNTADIKLSLLIKYECILALQIPLFNTGIRQILVNNYKNDHRERSRLFMQKLFWHNQQQGENYNELNLYRDNP